MNGILEITTETRDKDIHLSVEYSSELQLATTISRLSDSINDGWRLIRYRKGAVEDEGSIASYVPRSVDTVDIDNNPITITAEIRLHTYEQNSGNYSVQPDMASAVAAIGALNASDGYMLLDEFQGNTRIIFERPKLWVSTDDIDGTPLGQPNGHGRTDADRY